MYVATSVIRATAIEVEASDAKDGKVTVSAKAAGLADADAGITAKASGGSTVKYSGAVPLAIGVKLLQIVWQDNGPPVLDTVRDVLSMAGHVVSSGARLLGDDAFIAVTE